jgi:hypothetical protein
MDLTIMVADEVRSLRLTNELLTVMRKIEDALESRIPQAIYKIGFKLAHRLCSLAKKWGNQFAESWMSNASFARFLAIMHINDNRTVSIGSS